MPFLVSPRLGDLGGDKAAAIMRAVAKGLVGGMPAAAKGDGGFVGTNRKRPPLGVDDGNRAFHDERTVVARANGHLIHVLYSLLGLLLLG